MKSGHQYMLISIEIRVPNKIDFVYFHIFNEVFMELMDNILYYILHFKGF